MAGIPPELPDEARWALEYLSNETSELGEKAARSAMEEGFFDPDDEMSDDPVRAMAQDSWDFYYSSLTWDTIEALKPSKRDGLPARQTLLDHLFERAFLPAVREYVTATTEDDSTAS